MKFAGYSLAVSFSPISSNFIKNSCRFPVDISRSCHRNLRSSRFFSAKQQSHDKPRVVTKHYLPPWFSVAPMMDWTDHHYRTLARLISKHAWLYTEMLAAETTVHQKGQSGDFIYKASSLSPTKHFIIHSRKALLNGISPAENRSIAPLKYEYFYGLLRDFPDLTFTINGGITSVDEVNAAREAGAHGVMVGCAAYNNPWHILGHVDTEIYAAPSCGLARRQVLEKYQVYGDSVLGKYGHKPTVLDIVKIVFLYHAILVILGTVMLSGRTTDMGGT